MSAKEIASAEEAVRRIVGEDVARLLCPVLRDEHRAVVDAVERLPWGVEPVDVVGAQAVTMLCEATKSRGPIDPVADDADAPWARTLNLMMAAPETGSWAARRWVSHGEKLRWADAPVSSVFLATASYYAACCEDARGQDHGRWWWMQMASTETEADGRCGLGIVAVIRFARLCAWTTT